MNGSHGRRMRAKDTFGGLQRVGAHASSGPTLSEPSHQTLATPPLVPSKYPARPISIPSRHAFCMCFPWPWRWQRGTAPRPPCRVTSHRLHKLGLGVAGGKRALARQALHTRRVERSVERRARARNQLISCYSASFLQFLGPAPWVCARVASRAIMHVVGWETLNGMRGRKSADGKEPGPREQSGSGRP